MKLKAHFFILAILIITSPKNMYSMYTIFGAPVIAFPTPHYATKDLKTIRCGVTDYRADRSYSSSGQEVGLLSYQGTETLFKRFFDQSLPYNDSQFVGKALLSGSLRFIDLTCAYDQNIGEHFFFEIASSLTYIRLQDLLVQPARNNCFLLSQTHIDADSELKKYLFRLENYIYSLSTCSKFYTTTVGPSYLTIGYAHNFQNFTYIDFIDFSIQAGFALPETDIEPTATNNLLFNISTNNIKSIRFPIQASATVGLYDWLNIGVTGAFIGYAPTVQRVPLPTTKTCNIIFVPDHGFCAIHTRPLIFGSCYIEAEHFIPRVSLLAGISYSKQFKTTYESWDTNKFPDDIINHCPLISPWEVLNLTFSAEFDCADEDRKNLPIFKLVYILPVYGKSTFKTSALSGQAGCNLIYNF